MSSGIIASWYTVSRYYMIARRFALPPPHSHSAFWYSAPDTQNPRHLNSTGDFTFRSAVEFYCICAARACPSYCVTLGCSSSRSVRPTRFLHVTILENIILLSDWRSAIPASCQTSNASGTVLWFCATALNAPAAPSLALAASVDHLRLRQPWPRNGRLVVL